MNYIVLVAMDKDIMRKKLALGPNLASNNGLLVKNVEQIWVRYPHPYA